MEMATTFDINCTQCPRLADFLLEVKQDQPDYFCKPVPAFGDPAAKLLIVGLAPGMHGANATGRPFTGDYAGVLLYETMHKFGFASKPESIAADDDLQLINCRITNAVKCLPPQNKPTTAEIKTCNTFLVNELKALPEKSVVLALGSIAHGAVLRAMDYKLGAYKFGHAAEHQLDENFILLDSYHCSRYNTQTKRLTTEMFEAVFERAKLLLS